MRLRFFDWFFQRSYRHRQRSQYVQKLKVTVLAPPPEESEEQDRVIMVLLDWGKGILKYHEGSTIRSNEKDGDRRIVGEDYGNVV